MEFTFIFICLGLMLLCELWGLAIGFNQNKRIEAIEEELDRRAQHDHTGKHVKADSE